MIKSLRSIDTFSKNIILVFVGSSLVNVFNLLYQLLIAHRINPVDFAAFNSLLSIFLLISAPLMTVQTAIVKYVSQFNAHNESNKTRVLLSSLLKIAVVLAILTCFVFYFISNPLSQRLKISCSSCVFILGLTLALSWIAPILTGGIQGLELFKWFASVSVIGGALKLILAFVLLLLGFNIGGALGALFIATLAGVIITAYALKEFIFRRGKQEAVDFKGFFIYLLPVSITSFCFMSLVNTDMILVKYFFSPQDSGFYSIAQMVGKIFLYLPAAISLVMFPATSRLRSRNLDTVSTLKKSLYFALILCIFAILIYNLLPSFVLKVLTGKSFSESIILGRLFSLSMTFFTLTFVLFSYFLSIRDLRFLKYLVIFSILQLIFINLFHNNLIQIQIILVLNSACLFFIHLLLVKRNFLKENA